MEKCFDAFLEDRFGRSERQITLWATASQDPGLMAEERIGSIEICRRQSRSVQNALDQIRWPRPPGRAIELDGKCLVALIHGSALHLEELAIALLDITLASAEPQADANAPEA